MIKSFLNLEFFISWWAFVFPIAATNIALFKAYELSQNLAFLILGDITFLLLVCLALIVSFFTIRAILNDKICVSE
ncbi:MAG: hypothetical protein GXZ15_02095 [Campylobacter sp.]|nr:hypothetical protein [Campylobacter sp.]